MSLYKTFPPNKKNYMTVGDDLTVVVGDWVLNIHFFNDAAILWSKHKKGKGDSNGKGEIATRKSIDSDE